LDFQVFQVSSEIVSKGSIADVIAKVGVCQILNEKKDYANKVTPACVS